MGDELGVVDRRAGLGRAATIAVTALAPLLVGHAHDVGVDHGGWSFSVSSTSSGYTFSPAVLMQTEPRPSSRIVPSASTVAQSPGTDHMRPANVRNVPADLSGSL